MKLSKEIFSKLSMVLYLLVGSIILEFVCFHVLGFGVFPEYWLYDIAIVLFLGMVIFIIPNYTSQYVIATIILVIQAILIYANYTLFYLYGGELFTFDMFRLLSEAAEASNSSFFNFSLIAQLVLIVFAMATVGYLLLRICKKEKLVFKKHYAMLFVVMFACFEIFSLGMVFGYREQITASAEVNSSFVNSDSFLMNNTSFLKGASYQKFGTYGFYTNLLLQGYSSDTESVNLATIDYFDNGGEEDIYNSSPVFGVDKGNNVIVVMMESLEWFGFEDGSYDHDLNNLSSELTPNIYSLIYGDAENEADDSMVANNFFAKSKTNISEGYGIMGNYPIGQNLTDVAGEDYDSSLNAFGYSLPSILSTLGYNTTYVHSHDISFYSRNETHSNLGFDNVIGKNDILDENGEPKYIDENLKFNNWASEGDFIEDAMDYIVPESVLNGENFFTFYLSVSTHGDYKYNENNADQVRYKNYVIYGENSELDLNGNYQLKEEYALLEDKTTLYSDWYSNLLENYGDNPEFCEYAVNYQCGVVGLDVGIGKIIEQLKEYGIEDETTIILYSDHYAYYDSLAYDMKNLASDDNNTLIEANTIPFILSSPGLKSLNADSNHAYNYSKYEYFCSAYDIVPTILDLLGITFNQKFYVGTSLFDSFEYYTVEIEGEQFIAPVKIYYSNVGGLYSQYMYTSNLQDYVVLNSAKISDEDFEKMKQDAISIVTKLYYINVLNNNCLFSQLGNNQFIQT